MAPRKTSAEKNEAEQQEVDPTARNARAEDVPQTAGEETDAPSTPVAGAAPGVPDPAQGTERTVIASDEVPGDYDQSAESRLRAESAAEGPAYGVPGATGTVTGSENRGTLVVDVHSNLTLSSGFVSAGQKDVEVTDDSESRGALAAGHLSLSEEREDAEASS